MLIQLKMSYNARALHEVKGQEGERPAVGCAVQRKRVKLPLVDAGKRGHNLQCIRWGAMVKGLSDKRGLLATWILVEQ